MTFTEEIEQILDKYIVMKGLTDDRPLPVELKSFRYGTFSLHRNKSGRVFHMYTDDKTLTTTVSRQDGGYIEHIFFQDKIFEQIHVIWKTVTPTETVITSNGKQKVMPGRRTSVWTVTGVEDFEKFLMVVDKII